MLGVEGDYVAHGIDAVEAEEVIEKITKGGTLNARQAVEAAKGAFGKGITPEFPPDIKQEQSEGKYLNPVGARLGAPNEFSSGARVATKKVRRKESKMWTKGSR